MSRRPQYPDDCVFRHECGQIKRKECAWSIGRCLRSDKRREDYNQTYSERELDAAFKLLQKTKKALKKDSPLWFWKHAKEIVKNIYVGIPESCNACPLMVDTCYDDCMHGTTECLQNLERLKIIEVIVEKK